MQPLLRALGASAGGGVDQGYSGVCRDMPGQKLVDGWEGWGDGHLAQ